MKFPFVLSAAAFMAFFAAPAQAVTVKTLTESFSITASETVLSSNTIFPGTSFAKFDPALGTLFAAFITVDGPATWTSADVSPQIPGLFANLVLEGGGDISPPFFFTTPGTMTYGLIAPPILLSALAAFTGSGNAIVDLKLATTDPADTFQSSGLAGTVMYDYYAATPLPAALPLFAGGLGGLGLLGWRRKRKSATAIAV